MDRWRPARAAFVFIAWQPEVVPDTIMRSCRLHQVRLCSNGRMPAAGIDSANQQDTGIVVRRIPDRWCSSRHYR